MTGAGNTQQVRVGVAQFRPLLGEFEANVEMCLRCLREAADQNCALVVLPECATSGYMFESKDEAMHSADEVPGRATEAFESVCTERGLHCVVGVLERSGEDLHNTAVLIGPTGLIGTYRKTHLPFGGVDRFVTAGNELEIFETPVGRIAIEICYDLRFPELTKVLALKGAQIIAHPTNWPVAALPTAQFVTRARAYDNRIVLATANRCGPERWASFCGHSQIVSFNGERLAEATESDEGVVFADVTLPQAADRNIVTRPGEYELRLFDDRRWDLYSDLVEPPEPGDGGLPPLRRSPTVVDGAA